MQEFDNIKDMIYCEIDEISRQGKLDMNTVKILGELVDILKDCGTIEMFEENGYTTPDDDYSLASGYNRNGGGYSQRRPMYYYNNGGNSYRGGRNGGYSRGGSYRSGYSRGDAKEHMVQKLEHLMNEAQDEKDRYAIEQLIGQIENNQ